MADRAAPAAGRRTRRPAAAAAAAAAGCTLYGAPGSGSAAVEAALALCAVPYRVVHAATWEPGSAMAELEHINPLRQIPALVLADGSVLTESAAILIHLGLAYPASGLLPAAAPARAQAIRGLVFIAANCYAAIGVIDYPERWSGGASKAMNSRLRQGARARLHAYWAVFADTFPAPAAFYGGAAPGALDLLAAVVSKWSGARAFLRAKRPALCDLLERVDSHALVAPVFARHWANHHKAPTASSAE